MVCRADGLGKLLEEDEDMTLRWIGSWSKFKVSRDGLLHSF
jgi:hypothetical protein